MKYFIHKRASCIYSKIYVFVERKFSVDCFVIKREIINIRIYKEICDCIFILINQILSSVTKKHEAK